MNSKKKKKQFKNGRNGKKSKVNFKINHRDFFQDTSAEREEKLDSYYVNNVHLESAINENSKKSFFVGRTGIGKTAILKQVEKKTEKNIISIDPEDFAFKIIARSQILEKLTLCKINLDLFYKTMWKYIFVTEVLKEIYGNQRKSWIKRQITKLQGMSTNPSALRVYKFLFENDELDSGSSFNEKIEKIVRKLEHSIEGSINLGVINASVKLTKGDEKEVYNALKGFEFTEFNSFLKYIDSDKDVLKQHKFVILVDDLDKNWIQNEIGISFTRCLFETIFDINNLKNIRLIVSLRTNLFNQLEFNQREKFIPYINYVFWRKDTLKEIVEKRFKAIGVLNKSDIWNFILPKEITADNGRKFKTFDYLLKRSNMRPRDILFFISYAIENSIGKNKITQKAILETEKKYSKARLDALEDEWRNPYLEIGKIFKYFDRCKNKLKKDEFISIVESITLEILEKEEGRNLGKWSWIIEGNYIDKETFNYYNIVKLLYQVGFIGIKEYPNSTQQYIHNELNDMPEINDDTRFYINPCYYRAINVTFH